MHVRELMHVPINIQQKFLQIHLSPVSWYNLDEVGCLQELLNLDMKGEKFWKSRL